MNTDDVYSYGREEMVCYTTQWLGDVARPIYHKSEVLATTVY